MASPGAGPQTISFSFSPGSRRPGHDRPDQPCHWQGWQLSSIFPIPGCITPPSLTMAAGLLLWPWTTELLRVACRCWPHPFRSILHRKRATGSRSSATRTGTTNRAGRRMETASILSRTATALPAFGRSLLEPETKRPVGPPLPLYHIHQVRRSILNVGYGLMDIAVAPDKIVFNLGEDNRQHLDDKARGSTVGLSSERPSRRGTQALSVCFSLKGLRRNDSRNPLFLWTCPFRDL